MKPRPEDLLIVIAIVLIGQGLALIAYPLFLHFAEVCDGLWMYFTGFGQ